MTVFPLRYISSLLFFCCQAAAFGPVRRIEQHRYWHRQSRASDSSPLFAERQAATSSPSRWIACSSTKELTRAVKAYVQPGDRVAELGSALRETTNAICVAIGPEGRATLVDVKRNHPKRDDVQRTTAMRRKGDNVDFYPDRSRFVEIDSFSSWRSALFFNTDDEDREEGSSYHRAFDVLVADVSSMVGNDLDLTAVSLIKEFLELNDNLPGQEGIKCRVVVVKSGSLGGWANRLVHAQRLFGDKVSANVRRQLIEQKDGDSVDKHSDRFVSPIIVGTVGVEEYRKTKFIVRKGDTVLEVGCHLGTSTVELHGAALDESTGKGGCLGVDIGPKIIEGARMRYPGVSFEVANAWHTNELARIRKLLPNTDESIDRVGCYDVVYVDVGGLSGSDGLLEALSLLTALGNALKPRAIVIKSQCLRRLSGCLLSFSQIWQNDEEMRKRIG